MRNFIRMAMLTAALAAPIAGFAPAQAADAAATSTTAPHLLILARDGAFAGKLWSLAERPLGIDRSDPRVRRLLTGLTDAHGWLPRDRADWQEMDLAEAAAQVRSGDLAALAVIADPADPELAAALAGGQFRVVDLGDGVSRAHAAATGLSAGWFAGGQVRGVTLGGDTLVLDTPVQVADGAP